MNTTTRTSLLGLAAACLIYHFGRAENPPKIERNGREITVRFWTEAGQFYQLESSTNLVEWAPMHAPVPGMGGYLGFTETPRQPNKFYRLRQL
jgi:hypothetical protein